MKSLVLIGVSHHTAPLEVRERLVFPEEQLSEALRRLVADFRFRESMIVSTCNRVEVVADGNSHKAGDGALKDFLCQFHQVPASEVDPYLYTYRRNEAVRHIFRVACSLDSMVVGEPQILAQLKQAYRTAVDAGSVGRHLQSLLPRAFFVAKRVRTETRIAESAVSVSSVAVELARKIFGDLSGKSVLMLGAGKMGELAIRNLVSSGVSEVFVTNRTAERAHRLAARFQGSSIPFGDFERYLIKADIVLVSTGSCSFVLDRELMAPLIRRRKYRPLFIIDISVPRNVDPLINEIDNIFVYDIDDLQSVMSANLEDRHKEAEIAEAIVNQEVDNYIRRLGMSRAGPVIANLRRRLEDLCLEELRHNRAAYDPELYQLTERILRRTAHRLAHPLILKIKAVEDPSRRLQNLEWIKEAFDLDEDS